MERDGASLADTAERLVEAWAGYRKAIEWLRYAWGPTKFFAEEHWQDTATWPFDDTARFVAMP
jgi:hypothetical protein